MGFAGAKHQTILPTCTTASTPVPGGHGYATEAVLAVVSWLRSNCSELPVVARVATNNPASIRVAQGVGLMRQRVHDPADPVAHHLYASGPLGALS